MSISNIALQRALSGIGQVTTVGCYQPTARVAGTISYSPATPGVFTLANPPFVITDWLKVEIASANLPSELAEAEALFIRPVPAQTDKVYLYATFGYSTSPTVATVGLNPTVAFTGQIMDSDLEQQRSKDAVLAAYTAQYPGSVTRSGSFGSPGGGESSDVPTLSVSSAFSLQLSTNTSGSTRYLSHVLIHAEPYDSGQGTGNDGLIAIAPVQGQVNIPADVAPEYRIKATFTKLS